MFENYKVKLSRNKDIVSELSPNYILNYKADPKKANYRSHDIVSAFVGNNDVIVELDSDLFSEVKRQKDYIGQFSEDVGSFQLKSKYVIFPSARNSTILGIAINTKKAEAERITVYVPNAIWVQEQFKAVLPPCDIRYYIVKGQMEQDIVERLGAMQEKEKAEAFGSIIFDHTLFGRMGILSNNLSFEDATKILSMD